jgi:hypothetical protein
MESTVRHLLNKNTRDTHFLRGDVKQSPLLQSRASKNAMRDGLCKPGDDVVGSFAVAAQAIVEELAEDAALGVLVRHALPASNICVGTLLVVEGVEGGHDAGATTTAGAVVSGALGVVGVHYVDGWVK